VTSPGKMQHHPTERFTDLSHRAKKTAGNLFPAL
jgi:hypothetical protein